MASNIETHESPAGAEVITLKVQKLTPEAFAPYGTVLTFDTAIYPESDGGIPVIVKTRTRRKPGAQIIEQMATHFSYNQNFTVLKGSFIMVVAPPPSNPDAPFAEYHFEYDRAAAFLMEQGDCVDVARGTWHNGLTFEDECIKTTQTRSDVDRSVFRHKSEVVGGVIPVTIDPEQQKMQKTVEHVSLLARDNKVLEITL
jgi:ureidoglycolate hydrolase